MCYLTAHFKRKNILKDMAAIENEVAAIDLKHFSIALKKRGNFKNGKAETCSC